MCWFICCSVINLACGLALVRRATFRPISPSQHDAFLQYISTNDLDLCRPFHTKLLCIWQETFDAFYDMVKIAQSFLSRTHNPCHVLPEIQLTLPHLSKQSFAVKIAWCAQAGSRKLTHLRLRLVKKLHNEISHGSVASATRLMPIKSVWKAVRQITGTKHSITVADGISAESLNASISTDQDYSHPKLRSTCSIENQEFVSEWTVFQMLDQLQPTSTGLDCLPGWFLKLGAPVFCKPIAYLFYLAMHFSAKRGITIACRLSVCPSLCLSVTLVDCDHIGWNSSKIISPLVSIGCSLFATPTWRDCSKGNTLHLGTKWPTHLLIWASETFDRKLRPNGHI